MKCLKFKNGLVAALVLFLVILSARGQENPETRYEPGVILLNGFEVPDWMGSFSEHASLKTAQIEGVDGKALQTEFEFKNPEDWIQVRKNIPLKNYAGKSLRFWLKSTGEKKNLEIRLIDKDGTNFGSRETMDGQGQWRQVTFNLTDFSYWWGGDPKLDNISEIAFAITAAVPGKGTFALDELELLP